MYIYICTVVIQAISLSDMRRMHNVSLSIYIYVCVYIHLYIHAYIYNLSFRGACKPLKPKLNLNPQILN